MKTVSYIDAKNVDKYGHPIYKLEEEYQEVGGDALMDVTRMRMGQPNLKYRNYLSH